jgi:diaminopimelate epimerase
VAGAMTGRTERTVTIHLKGGDLLIDWRDDNRVYMTGGAEEVFHGTVRI